MERAADRIYETLKRYWGFTEFRPVQGADHPLGDGRARYAGP